MPLRDRCKDKIKGQKGKVDLSTLEQTKGSSLFLGVCGGVHPWIPVIPGYPIYVRCPPQGLTHTPAHVVSTLPHSSGHFTGPVS